MPQRIDLGCGDFGAAKRNRERIANPTQEELNWWSWYEAAVKYTPHGIPLGQDVPIGELPQAGKKSYSRNYGGGGMNEETPR